MEKILIYLIKNKKKYAVLFDNEAALRKLTDLNEITEKEFINNAVIPDTESILERWEVKNAQIKNITKNRNTLKLTVDIDCKLLIRKISEK